MVVATWTPTWTLDASVRPWTLDILCLSCLQHWDGNFVASGLFPHVILCGLRLAALSPGVSVYSVRMFWTTYK